MKYLLLVLALALPCHGQMLQAIVGQSSGAAATHKTATLVAGQVCETATAGSTSYVCNMPANVTNGNGLACSMFFQSSTATVTAAAISDLGSGNPLQSFTEASASPVHGTGNTSTMHYITSISIGAASNRMTFTMSGSVAGAVHCDEYTNIASFDTSIGAAGSGSGSVLTTGSLNTAQDHELVVCGGGIKTGTETFTSTSGFTIQKQRAGGSESEFIADQTITAAGAINCTTTVGTATANEWVVIQMALKTPLL